MADTIAEQGAVQTAIANKATPVPAMSRLGAAGAIQQAVADAVTNGKNDAKASRLAGQGKTYSDAAK
jgi:hypothetical protein